MGCVNSHSSIDINKAGGLGVARIKPDTLVNCLISWNEQASDVTAQYRVVPVNIESNTQKKKKGQKVQEVESSIRGEWTDLHLEVKNKGERFSKTTSLPPGVYELRYFVDGTEHPGAGRDGEIYHKFSVECTSSMWREEEESNEKNKGKDKKAKATKDKKESKSEGEREEGEKKENNRTDENIEQIESKESKKKSYPEEEDEGKLKTEEKTNPNTSDENSSDKKTANWTSKGSAVVLPTIQKAPSINSLNSLPATNSPTFGHKTPLPPIASQNNTNDSNNTNSREMTSISNVLVSQKYETDKDKADKQTEEIKEEISNYPVKVTETFMVPILFTWPFQESSLLNFDDKNTQSSLPRSVTISIKDTSTRGGNIQINALPAPLTQKENHSNSIQNIEATNEKEKKKDQDQIPLVDHIATTTTTTTTTITTVVDDISKRDSKRDQVDEGDKSKKTATKKKDKKDNKKIKEAPQAQPILVQSQHQEKEVMWSHYTAECVLPVGEYHVVFSIDEQEFEKDFLTIVAKVTPLENPLQNTNSKPKPKGKASKNNNTNNNTPNKTKNENKTTEIETLTLAPSPSPSSPSPLRTNNLNSIPDDRKLLREPFE